MDVEETWGEGFHVPRRSWVQDLANNVPFKLRYKHYQENHFLMLHTGVCVYAHMSVSVYVSAVWESVLCT